MKICCVPDGVLAYEAVVGILLPGACPERHINADGSFCLGLDKETYPTAPHRASVWWELLHNFLKLQHAASRSKSWPPRQALSHGNAGAHQLKAIEAAKQLGIEEQYLQMLEGEPSWISNRYLRAQKGGSRLCNGKRPCPKGCKRKNGAPVLRRACDKRELIAALILHERRRRKAEADFWKDWIGSGRVCCGTMRNCPLATLAETRPNQLLRRRRSKGQIAK